jgi:tetratricopeptide (TPR) repeat protein
MHNALTAAILLGLVHLAGLAEPPDLTPLLPPATASNGKVIEALQSGEVSRAATLIESLAPAEQALWRGILAIVRNDATTAIRTLRHTRNPKALGVAYYVARQYLLFRDEMSEAIRGDPRDFGPYYFLGRHYDSDLDNCEEAVRWFRQALDRNPAYSRIQAYLGGCLERLGHSVEAGQAYRASLSLPLSQLGLARLKSAAGQNTEALELAERALAAEPLNAAGQRLAARLYETEGRAPEAIRALEAAAKAAPYDASVQYALYRLHRSSGDEAKAAQSLREYERLRQVYGSQPQ